MHAPSIYTKYTHAHIYNGRVCVCLWHILGLPGLPACCGAYWISSQFFLLPYFSSPPYDCCQCETARERESGRERDNCVHMLVHVHMQLSCFCFTSTFIFSCRFLRPFLMRRKMKSFSGFFSGHFPATSLSATVCLLFCTQMLTFFPTSLYLFLSGCLHSKYIFALMNKVFFRLPASALCFAGRQARQGQMREGRGGHGLALACGKYFV